MQLIRADGVAEIDAKYLIETSVARACSCTTDAVGLQWLMQHVFVGTGAVSGDGIELRGFKVT